MGTNSPNMEVGRYMKVEDEDSLHEIDITYFVKGYCLLTKQFQNVYKLISFVFQIKRKETVKININTL